jgi:hypothetical protein
LLIRNSTRPSGGGAQLSSMTGGLAWTCRSATGCGAGVGVAWTVTPGEGRAEPSVLR